MLTSLLQSFVSAVIERLAASTIGGVAAQSAAEAAIQEADCLDRLEEAARSYEAAGKPQLAARLRERAASVTFDTSTAIPSLEHQTKQTALIDAKAKPDEESRSSASPKRRRRRSAASKGAEQ